MSKWVEVIVARATDGDVAMGYAYWPLPDVWHGNGMVEMAGHICSAMERWYKKQGGFEGDATCYRPVVRLVKLNGMVEFLVSRHWARYAPDDLRQFTGSGCYHRSEAGDNNGT